MLPEETADLTPPLHDLRLLDAGCGTGRRLSGTGAALAVGVDISPETIENLRIASVVDSGGLGRGKLEQT